MIYWQIEHYSKPTETSSAEPSVEAYESCSQAVRRFVELKKNSTVYELKFYEIEKTLMLEKD